MPQIRSGALVLFCILAFPISSAVYSLKNSHTPSQEKVLYTTVRVIAEITR